MSTSAIEPVSQVPANTAPPDQPVPTFRDSLRQVIATLTDEALELIDDGDLDPILTLWAQLNLLQKGLRELSDELQSAAVPLMPWEEHPRTGKRVPAPRFVEGVGTIQAQPGARYVVWDIEAAVKALVADAMAKGEINHPQDVANVIRAAAGGGLSYLKVGELKGRGLDVEEFRAAAYARATLRFVG